MKKLLIFISGVIVGVFLTFSFLSSQSVNSNNNLQLFETPEECVTKKNLKVFQALEDGYALANEIEGPFDFSTHLVVLIHDPEGKPFYDDQKIIIPKGKCARKIGIYKYITRNEMEKTVPIVQIMK